MDRIRIIIEYSADTPDTDSVADGKNGADIRAIPIQIFNFSAARIRATAMIVVFCPVYRALKVIFLLVVGQT